MILLLIYIYLEIDNDDLADDVGERFWAVITRRLFQSRNKGKEGREAMGNETKV